MSRCFVFRIIAPVLHASALRSFCVLNLILSLFLASTTAHAICTPIAQRGPAAAVTLANWSGGTPPFRPAAQAVSTPLPKPGTLELTYLGHSTFLIRTAGGVSAVTDYNDGIVPPFTPTIATMNQAHETHFSYYPDPKIKHVLKGWEEEGEGDGDGVAIHELQEGDLLVRNIPTNIRDYGSTIMAGNSIFIFETAGLCIAHLGHLHHTLTKTHIAALGIIDVLMVPVDGTFTLDQDLMAEVVKQINPSLVIPMHMFGPYSLARFLGYLEDKYRVRRADTPTVVLSRNTLPFRTVLVLPGY